MTDNMILNPIRRIELMMKELQKVGKLLEKQKHTEIYREYGTNGVSLLVSSIQNELDKFKA